MRKMFAHAYEKQPVALAHDAAVAAAVDEYRDDSCRDSTLVFVNGRYAPSLSRTAAIPAGVVAGGLSALETQKQPQPEAQSQEAHAPALRGRVEQLLALDPDADAQPRDSYASDVMGALNYANLEDAAVLYAAAGVECEDPIQVIFCSTAELCGPGASDAAAAAYCCLLAYLEEGAALKLKQSFVSASLAGASETQLALPQSRTAASFVSANTRIHLAENSRLEHTLSQELSAASRYVEVLTADLHHNASYDLAVLQSGSTIGRLNAHIDMKSQGSNCSLYSAHLAGERQSLDLHSSITHAAPECVSRQQQRNVVADRGEAIFKGRIRIPKEAQMTDSAQLCRSIMLGQRARVIAMPTLEITADNVECSHGASVADLDENSMFYLASRGIDRQEARKLLLRAFVFDMLTNAVMDEKSKRRVLTKIENLYRTDEERTRASAQKYVSI